MSATTTQTLATRLAELRRTPARRAIGYTAGGLAAISAVMIASAQLDTPPGSLAREDATATPEVPAATEPPSSQQLPPAPPSTSPPQPPGSSTSSQPPPPPAGTTERPGPQTPVQHPPAVANEKAPEVLRHLLTAAAAAAREAPAPSSVPSTVPPAPPTAPPAAPPAQPSSPPTISTAQQGTRPAVPAAPGSNPSTESPAPPSTPPDAPPPPSSPPAPPPSAPATAPARPAPPQAEPAPKPPALSPSRPDYHTVRPGQTLSQIAHNLRTDPQHLKRLNRLPNDRIHTGDRLRLHEAVPPRIDRPRATPPKPAQPAPPQTRPAAPTGKIPGLLHALGSTPSPPCLVPVPGTAACRENR